MKSKKQKEVEDSSAMMVGKIVSRIRLERSLTQKELAYRANLSVRLLTELEKGRANPSLRTLDEIASALDIPVVSLLLPWFHLDDLEQVRRLAKTKEEKEVDAPSTYRKIVLLGLRGAGKSTVGRLLAKSRGIPFIEVDGEVEAKAGMELRSIFEFHGERHYRGLEAEVVRELTQGPDEAILGVSGGIVTEPESWELIANTFTVWLKAPPDAHWKRVIDQGDSRPMAGNAKAREELERLYWARAPFYENAVATILTDQRDPEEVALEIGVRWDAIRS